MVQAASVLLIVLMGICKCCDINDIPGTVHCSDGNIYRFNDDNIDCHSYHLGKHTHYRCIKGEWKEILDNSTGLNKVQKVRRKRGFGEALLCVLTFFSCLWYRPRPSDTTPPQLMCPNGITYGEIEPFQIYRKVYWNEPSAKDDRDGYVTAKRMYGRPSGSRFPEGWTEVRYEAKDRRGNRATCTMQIHIQIVRCKPEPKELENGYFICHPSTEFVLGAWCQYGCYDGYELIGESVRVCQENNEWSGSHAPSCSAIRCPKLQSLEGAGLPSCTNANYFRSVCTYNCKIPGFDMPQNVAKAIVCSNNKLWMRTGEPKCLDVEPPQFDTCPSIVVSGTDKGSNTSSVSWPKPTAIDNSNGKINVMISRGPGPESKLYPGRYEIEYVARDKAGNKGRPCRFNVIVRDIKCSRIYPTPYVRVICPQGYKTGSLCDIECEPGNLLKGSDNVTCEESKNGLFAYWNWQNGTQSTCKNTLKCTMINPPRNGAVVCDNWLGGTFCQGQCRSGTEMPNVDLTKLYVCSREVKWDPTPQFKPCKTTEHAYSLRVTLLAECFYSGDCKDKSTQQQIANNFIQQMRSNHLFQPEACPDDSQCNVDGVQIFCGSTSRRKRDVATNGSNDLMQHRLSIEITLKMKPTENIIVLQNQRQNLINSLGELMESKRDEVFGEHTASSFNISSGPVKIMCTEGSVNSIESLRCIECPEGTYYQKRVYDMDPTCILCPKGTFQAESGQSVCKACPEGFSTNSKGSTQLSDCKVACSPGTFSQNGLEPCFPCDVGHYQPSHGQVMCRRCLDSKSTLTFGASSRADCQEFDIIFNGNSSVTSIIQNLTSVSDLTMNFWIKANSDSTEFEIHLEDEIGIIIWEIRNFSEVCHNKIMCKSFENVLAFDNLWHRFTIQFIVCSVFVNIDGFLANSINFGTSCSSFKLKTVYVQADSSFTLSQLNLWHGQKDMTSEVHCFSHQFGDLLRWQDFDGSIVDGAFIDIPSQCDDIDNCMSKPCLHGECSDRLNGYDCTCDVGFTSQRCDVNIDDCTANVCMNGATCVDEVASYNCSCVENYTGKYCEIEKKHGQWSVWGNWSECTTTCGRGQMSRKRLCTNPTPSNGGDDCAGLSEDFQPCNNTDCPDCPALVVPGNGTAECKQVNGTFNCSIYCDEGFEFDMEPLHNYYCGPETAHVWNFDTFSNPLRKLPSCKETVVPKSLSVRYSAKYKDLVCSSQHLALQTNTKILSKARTVVESISVIETNACTLNELTVTDCDDNSRMKRSTEFAGFRMTISTNPQNGDITKGAGDLETAFNAVMGAIQNGNFTVHVLEDSYELDQNQTEASGEADCEPGFTRVGYFCVPCGSGTYFNVDYCELCPVGTYQEKERQTSCSLCPDGKSTLGEGSASIEECSGSSLIYQHK
ncbi:sushi, von Willebrand factor type A, EGF and pentraxin domain-containing protein 1-like isoform X2 [Mya arenaria]|uniref:sushi, von Willebrand factor type A, EGF and pentraxin domain-containing protein 1-like isoform X2 n=1 Tax=Mya arenaria TaxID=6604 RepID=UPI0022E2419B|nr:sushi, von Willebrand factor type A, EGF and pentraxin domain-containing protein 1-like isoform X2 [Mya arenaria]